MRNPLWLASALLLVIGPDAWAKGSLARAEDELDDALQEVLDADRSCRKAVQKDVEDAIKDVKRASSRKQMRRLIEDLEDLKKEADDCPRTVEKALKNALRYVEDALEGEEEEDEERPAREKKKKKIDCWKANDPGCTRTKNGQPPMAKHAYNSLFAAVKAQSPHIFQMVDTMKAGIASHYLTSEQLRQLVELFRPHVFQMLDAVKAGAPRLVDPDNGSNIGASFQPHVFQAQEAVQIIASQSSDPQ